MKTRFILLIFILCYQTFNLPAQIPLYELKLDNFIPNGDYYTANEFTFDITIRSRNGTDFEYAGGQFLINFNLGVANGGTLSFSIAGPDTSDLPVNLRPENPHVTRDSNGIHQLALDMNAFPGAGNGYIINGITPAKIIKLKLSTTAPTFSMEGAAIGGWWYIDLDAEWRNNPPFTDHTKVFAYIIRTAEVNITNPGWHWVQSDGLLVNPVELTSFTHTVNKNNVTLDWITSGESDNSGFEIERSADNANNIEWIKSGFVTGFGTTNESVRYSFTEKLNTGNYFYRLKQIDFNGNFEYFYLSGNVNIGLPNKTELLQNYPNPFNPSTKISFAIANSSKVSLNIYDISGKEVTTLIDGIQNAGYYELIFNAVNLPAGIYFYRLISNDFSITKRMILIK